MLGIRTAVADRSMFRLAACDEGGPGFVNVSVRTITNAMEQSNCLEETRFSENPHQYGDYPARGEEHKDDLQRESDGSQPLDTLTDHGEARNDFLDDPTEFHLSSSR